MKHRGLEIGGLNISKIIRKFGRGNVKNIKSYYIIKQIL